MVLKMLVAVLKAEGVFFMYIGRMHCIVWIIVTTILGIAAPADADEFRIAVRASKGHTEAMSRWQAERVQPA